MQDLNSIQFSKEEMERYSRHLIIPEFNIEGQKRLKASSVLVIGTGGLGSPVLQYLAAAGVGTLGIVDFDTVESTNLQRQTLFTVNDIGRNKVDVAKERLEAMNPYIEVKTYNTRLTSENAMEIFRGYDLVADGTDNFPTRYLVNDACVLLGLPNVYASIFRFEGQLSVFNYTAPDGTLGPNYRDLYASPPPPELVPSCAEGGVIGVLPGILGTWQANEVLKVLTGVGEPVSGRLLLFDALSFGIRDLKIKRDPDNPINGEHPTITELIDYEEFCGVPGLESAAVAAQASSNGLQEITPEQLDTWRRNGQAYKLIDVREDYEYAIANIGGQLIPKDQVPQHLEAIPKDQPVVVHCRSGKRSADVIHDLIERYGYEHDKLFNLQGGILAYADQVDHSLAKY
jgi:adenylyltransferase/sulfurtransferase